jgi:hypothetical protein
MNDFIAEIDEDWGCSPDKGKCVHIHGGFHAFLGHHSR